MPVIEALNDDHCRALFAAAASKTMIVDFTAAWCGPCKMIAPIFEGLSNKYMGVQFLKVDVDKCEETAAMNGVSAMPTFMVFVNGKKMDTMKGANTEGLESLVSKWSNVGSSGNEIPGQLDLNSLIELPQVECLNGCDDTPIRPFLEGPSLLRSDCDEQLILTIPFTQPIRLHSIQLKGNGGKAPKIVKVFANLPKTLDFDDAQSLEPVQTLEFGQAAQDGEGEIQPLKYVKFQNVRSIQLFLENNQEGGEVTELSDLKFHGTPVNAVNMSDFKRVAGKKGEVGH